METVGCPMGKQGKEKTVEMPGGVEVVLEVGATAGEVMGQTIPVMAVVAAAAAATMAAAEEEVGVMVPEAARAAPGLLKLLSDKNRSAQATDSKMERSNWK